jgi:prepilin-type N-terminal cleavage/methylation domain-containing protein
MRTLHRSPPPRGGFTLVEMLVVITIFAVLAGLAVLIFPRLQDSTRVARGADSVQGALFMAKQWALRDHLPRGVRLVYGSDGLIHSLQYIEQPLPYNTGTLLNVQTQPGLANTSLWSGGTYFRATFDPSTVDFSTGAVLAGDYLDLTTDSDAYPAMHYIGLVGPTAASNYGLGNNELILLSQPQGMLFPGTFPYNIVRGPRPMVSEQMVNLPNGVIVNTGGSILQSDSQTGQMDILFSSTGKVMRTAGQQGKVVLWISDATGNPMDQEQRLVVVYTRTGTVGIHPVNVSGADPYSFVKDGRDSGM